MIKRTLTICAVAAMGTAGVSVVQAQQAYPAPPGGVYSAAPPASPDYRRGPGAPDFEALEDDEAPNAAALPSPGPVLSPDDPRYGRRDPPPVIYSDRPAGSPQQAYGDNRIPGSGYAYPDEDNRGLRPPGAVGAPGNATGTVQQQPPQGSDGAPMVRCSGPSLPTAVHRTIPSS